MNTRNDPRDLVVSLLGRSTCNVQVAALVKDQNGIFSWGWNHAGFDGRGQHAESHCLWRSNMQRLPSATIYVAARRRENSKIVSARPCERCQRMVLFKVLEHIVYRNEEGKWLTMK